MVAVKNNQLLEDLVDIPVQKRKTDKLAPLSNVSRNEASSLSDRGRRENFLAERKQKLKEKRAEDTETLKRNLRWRLQDANEARDRREADRLKKIQEEQDGFVADVDNFLKNKTDQARLATKELHHVWDSKVYKRIESQIAEQTGKMDSSWVNNRLCDQMEKYVEAVASKTLFRDIIIESEYNPFESKSALIKVDARPRSKTVWAGIKDPLNEQIEKVMEIHQDKTPAEMPILGKDPSKATLPLREWAAGVIEDTPHGFAFKAFEKSIAELDMSFEEKQERAKRNVSTLTMEHYNYARGAAAVSAEYPKGKRCYPGWKPGGGSGPDEGVGAALQAPPEVNTQCAL